MPKTNQKLKPFNQLPALPGQLCLTLWALWIAAVRLPDPKALGVFTVLSVGLFILLMGFKALITYSFTKKQTLISGHVLVIVILIMGGSLVFTNRFAMDLAFGLVILFVLYLLCLKHFPKAAAIFYAASWAWLVPLIFTTQSRDIETITALVTLTIFCFTLTFYIVQTSSAHKLADNLIGLTVLKAISFALLIAMGVLSGQSLWYFIGLLITLGIFAYQLCLISSQHSAQAARYYPWIAGLLLIGIALSYPF